MFFTDSHVHTCFSTDSTASCESMIEAAISIGLKRLCITDHKDIFYPHPENGSFDFDMEAYFSKMQQLRDIYSSRIDLCIGAEFGLRNEPDMKEKVRDIFNSLEKDYPLDYIIGSTHILNNYDPYVRGFWTNISSAEGISRYFKSISDNLRYYNCFDSYGHADYIIRYIPDETKAYIPADYSDLIDEFLKLLIQHGKALECNTAGYKYGLSMPHPHIDILKRYHELGGELLTIGSDAHKPEHLAYDYKKAYELLSSIGFKYYTFYKNRKPEFISL